MSSLKRLFIREASAKAGADAELVTERLRLRALRDIDVRRIAQLAGDWSIASMTARIPFPYTERDAVEWVSGLGEGEVVRAIEHGGELIGLVGYTPTPDGRAAELGYWIGRPHWGQGYATEAARAIVAHCFEAHGFERLTCCHFIDNPASQRVIEKLGFRIVGPCSAWSEARRRDAPTLRYELLGPSTRGGWSRLWRKRGA